ncbi:MAG: MFS transporter [Sphingobacteriales bacterium]|nr:MAG: MFS transporter [Sphingobacteriales bacterium]
MEKRSSSSGRHPKGLPYLFFTEMWERFGYYLMLGIFVLYMIDVDKGGLSIDDAKSYDVFGTFIALTYLTPFLGGFLADKVLGYIRSVYIGGTLMGLGYLLLGFPVLRAFGVPLSQEAVMQSFYAAIALVVIGNGFFKPSISTLLGNLYSYPQFKDRKDWGYNLFYMGINVGALLGPILAAFMRNKYSWPAAFITAGVGMFIGLIVFTSGLRHIRPGERKSLIASGVLDASQNTGGSSIGRVLGAVFLPALVAGALGWFLPELLLGPGKTLLDSHSTDAFLFACIPVVIFYISLWAKAREGEKRPIAALLAVFAVSIIFWAVFKQNGTALTNWAKYYTDREISGAVQPLATKLYQTEELSALPKQVSVYDAQFRAERDASGKVKKALGQPVYFRNQPPDRIPADGRPVYVAAPELFQSINPGWVVLLTPVVVAVFAALRRRGKEPTTPGKIAIGLLISALSTLVMVLAVQASLNGAVKVSAWYLIFTYGVVTIGELCLSPMGLSLVSKLSPPRYTALMMGGSFLATSIGNKLSGVLAGLWYGYENKANFFVVNCFLLLGAALLAFLMLRWLNRVMAEKGVR